MATDPKEQTAEATALATPGQIGAEEQPAPAAEEAQAAPEQAQVEPDYKLLYEQEKSAKAALEAERDKVTQNLRSAQGTVKQQQLLERRLEGIERQLNLLTGSQRVLAKGVAPEETQEELSRLEQQQAQAAAESSWNVQLNDAWRRMGTVAEKMGFKLPNGQPDVARLETVPEFSEVLATWNAGFGGRNPALLYQAAADAFAVVGSLPKATPASPAPDGTTRPAAPKPEMPAPRASAGGKRPGTQAEVYQMLARGEIDDNAAWGYLQTLPPS